MPPPYRPARGTLPLRPSALTPPVLAHDPVTATHAGVTGCLSHLGVHGPQTGASVSPPWCRDGRGQGVTPPRHRAQRPLSAQPALAWAPPVAWPPRARLGAWGLRGWTAREPTPCSTPRQSGGQRMPRRWGVHRRVAAHLGRAPGRPGHPRAPARLPPLSRVPCHLGLGLARRCARPRGWWPLPREAACACAAGVQHGTAPRDGRAGDRLGSLARHASGGMRQPPPARQPLAASGEDVLQARPVGAALAPTRPAALWTPRPRPPRHAGGCQRQHNRRAMQHEGIPPPPQDSPLTARIASGPPPPGLPAGLAPPAPSRRPTRGTPLRHDKGPEQDERPPTSAQRRARSRTGLLVGLGPLCRRRPCRPQGRVFCCEPLVSWPQSVVTAPTDLCARPSVSHTPGRQGDSGATRATWWRPPRHRSPSPTEDGGGMAQPGLDGDRPHGSAPPRSP